MMQALSKKQLFILAFAVLALTNAVVLAGIAYNRYAGEVRSITLSERELSLPYSRWHGENSGLSLRLSWSVFEEKSYGYYSRQPAWLDRAKLEALGFDVTTKEDDGHRALSKEVLIVLEYNNAEYQKALKQMQKRLEEKRIQYEEMQTPERKNALEYAQNELDRSETSQSRLFAVDAGLDLQALTKKYSDTSRYVIAKGIVRPQSRNGKGVLLSGYIERLSIENVYVSLQERHFFETLASQKDTSKKHYFPPRYEVTLSYGSRLEPWIQSVTK